MQPFNETENAGNPEITSATKGEDITPDNPEVVQQFPVETPSESPVVTVEGTVDRSQRSHEWLDRNPE